jgi:hypothetical protein
MTSQNNLARWTQPTTDKEKRFFSQNSGAISRNSMVLWLIQAIWIMFSHGPATHLLQSKLSAFPVVQEFAWLFALGILAFLHYVLHDEILETISNIVDGVKETVNGIMNWLVPAGIIIALVLLDALGIANNFRDDTFETQRLTNTSAAKTELAQAVTDYQQSLKNIESTRKDDSLAAIAPFNLAINKAQKIKTYDQYDIKSKDGKIATLKSERSLAVAEVRKSASAALKEAQSTYLAEKQRITGKRDSTDTTLVTADKENEAASWGYGWTISVFILFIFVAIAYKLVVLRVESGIRKNVAFTELDAQGGFLEKLAVAFSDITKRQGHRFLVWFHTIGSMGTATLHDFDGKVILRESSYNTPDDIKAPKGGNNGGGSQGGSGGSGSIPPHLPPAPGQPLGGQSVHGAQKKQWQKPAISTPPATTTTEIAQSFWNDLSPDTKLDIVNKLKAQTGLPIRELYITCEKHNPQIPFFDAVVTEVNELYKSFEIDTAPTPSVQSIDYELSQDDISVQTETKNPVPQSAQSVPQPNGQKRLSELDDTIERLRGEILKNSESHFKRGDAKNNTVAKRIFESCDKAFMALRKGGDCTPSVLSRFKEVALDRLDLCASYECYYDSRIDLINLISDKEGRKS